MTMSTSFKFDPVSRDLIRNGRGWFTMTSNQDTTVMHQLLCHADECWHDPQLGSRLHDLKKLQVRPEVTAPSEARRSLDVLVSRGRISNVEVIAEIPRPGRINLATKFRDTKTGQIVPLKVSAGR
jgi:phage gp46-like protein